MRILLFLLGWLALLVAAPTPAQGQFLFQKSLGTGQLGETSSQMIALRSGGYLLAGNRIGPYLTRVDEQGDTLWTREYQNTYTAADFPNGAIVSSIAENRSGQILLAGGGTHRVGNRFDGGGLLLLLDGATGNIIWSRISQSPLLDAYHFVVLGNDGHFVLIGWELGAPMAMKLDSTGRSLWTYPIPGVDSLPGGPFLIHRISGGYVVSNFKQLPTAPYFSNELHFLDEAGQLLFVKPSFGSGFPSRCVQDGQGEFLFCNGALNKTTALGDTLWSKNYRIGGSAFTAQSAALTPDGNYVVLGYRQYQVQADWVLLKIAPDGQVIRDTILYRPSGNEYATDVLVDAQGNYVLYGWTSNGTVAPGGSPDLILAKYRGWRQLLGTAAPASEYVAEAVGEVFPNPATTAFTLRLPTPARGRYALRDALGRVVRQGAFSTQTSPSADASVSVAGLPAGLYWLTYVPTAAGQASRTWRVAKE